MRNSALSFPAAVWALVVVGSTACLGDVAGPVDPTTLTFAPSLGVDLDEMELYDSGLYVQDELVGEGDEVEFSDSISFHYTGWLHDGTQFDTSAGRDPITANNALDWNGFIFGVQEGLVGMRPGGIRLLVIPSHLGYGGRGQDLIPPYATLVVRVEMLAGGPQEPPGDGG